MRFWTFSLAASLITGGLAVPSNPSVLHEKRDNSPELRQKRQEPEPGVVLPMRIGLTQQNIEQGPSLLMEVSSHESPKYGKQYSAEEVLDIFAPSEIAVKTVREWLESAGIAKRRVSQSFNKQWIQFDAKVQEVESLLKTQYYLWEDGIAGNANVGCYEYYIPAHVREHVDYITPGVKLLPVSRNLNKPDGHRFDKRSFGYNHGKGKDAGQPIGPIMHPLPIGMSRIAQSPAVAACDAVITPACIRALYNFNQSTTKAEGNELGIFQSLGDVYAQEDLDLFFQSLQSRIPRGTHPVPNLIDGAIAPVPVSRAGPESDLDFQISYPIIWPQNAVLYQTDDPVYQARYSFTGFLNNLLDAIDGSYCTYGAFGLTGNSAGDPPYPDPAPGGYKGQLQCGVYKPTKVIAISYGGDEAQLPQNYQRRQCNEFLKLGMQGTSVIIASGDFGVAGAPDTTNPTGCLGRRKQIFNPDFPSNCPYVTTVGATFLPPGASATNDSETATESFPSGGGFSNIYPAPLYQRRALRTYFTQHDPGYPSYASVYNSSFGAHGGLYNRVGRGYPDVAAVGDNIIVYVRGSPALLGGTSASAPVFAALLTRVNEERIARGKGSVGFVNPVLYAHPGVLNDVTVGRNPGCGTKGFEAVQGWDPITGLGTPNYPRMRDLFLKL